jgi:hypothetical protein
VALALTILLGSCGSQPKLEIEGPYWVEADNQHIPEPEYREPNLPWISVKRTFFDQAEELFDVGRNLRKLGSNLRQAININSYDEVPNCSWFSNRHGLAAMTPAEIKRGRSVTPGPDTTGSWLVFRPKVSGATPGFWIEDARGDQYIIKFDPVSNPELATGAAALGVRYFHACGYNVPQETIVYWRPEMLRIKEGATIRSGSGEKRPLTEQDLQEILAQVRQEADGSIRSLASLNLGNVKGPFLYSGRRADDPNDWYSHQDRRELRGLYVIASLVNHYDLKDHNSLDVYEEENGRGFLRHYLIDFGSTFGSDGNGPKVPIKGYANIFDLRDVSVSTVTLGIKGWGWEDAVSGQHPSIGYFESEIFEPHKFDCIVPNPAFEQMTDRDAYWGAKIVMAWRDEHLRALVESGRYSDPEAAEYLLETLKRRRDKIGRHWLGKVNPLDNFELSAGQDALQLTFEDLAIKYELEPATAGYRYRVSHAGADLFGVRATDGNQVLLSGSEVDLMASRCRESFSTDDLQSGLIELNIETRRAAAEWSQPTRLWLAWRDSESRFELIAIEHLD